MMDVISGMACFWFADGPFDQTLVAGRIDSGTVPECWPFRVETILRARRGRGSSVGTTIAASCPTPLPAEPVTRPCSTTAPTLLICLGIGPIGSTAPLP